MKRENKSTESLRSIDSLLAKLSGDELLNVQHLLYIRGGEGEGDGGAGTIIIPPPPPPRPK